MTTRSYSLTQLWLWLVVTVLCLGGGGVRILWNQQHRARIRAWEANDMKLEWAARRTYESLSRLRTQQPNITRQELEQQLNGNRPFRIIVIDNREIATWTDPNSGAVFELRFNSSGRLIFWRANLGESALSPPYPSRHLVDQLSLGLQRIFASPPLGVGTVAWVVTFVVFVIWRQKRRVLAELLLALALIYLTARVTWPSFPFTFQGILRNELLPWALVMVGLSIALLLANRRLQLELEPRPWPACSGCGYDLTGNTSGVCPECGTRVT
jgi:hypothetical protein